MAIQTVIINRGPKGEPGAPGAPGSGVPAGVTVVKTSDTELTFDVVGGDATTRSGYLPVKAPGIITGVPYRVFDITDRQFGAVSGTLTSGPDVTAAIQSAIDAAQTHGEGVVLIPKGSFWFANLIVPEAVVLQGVHRNASRLHQLPAATGPSITIAHPPGAIAADGAKAMLRDFYLGGGAGTGVIQATGATTAGSDVITGVAGSGGAQVGWIVQAVGVPEFALIESIGGGVINMSRNAVGSNGARQRLLLREAYTLAATTTAGQLFVSMTSTAGLRAGMRVRGTGVDNDETMIAAMAPGGITLDRPATGSGATSLLCYVSNDGIYLPDAALAPAYDPMLEYGAADFERLYIDSFSGWGLHARPGRHQPRWRFGKLARCDTGGVNFASVNDGYLHDVASGNHWGPAVRFATGATPRIIGGEIYSSYNNVDYNEVEIRKCNASQVMQCEINGSALVVGDPAKTNICTISGVNFVFHSGNVGPDGTAVAYVKAKDAKVMVRDGGFMPDPTSGERPNHIAYAEGPRGLVVVDVDGWPDGTSDPQCPYAVAPTLTAGGGKVSLRYTDTATGKLRHPAIDLPDGMTITAASNTQARLRYLGSDAVLREALLDLTPVAGPPEPPEWYNRSIAPVLADIASYKVAGATERWDDLVWGPAVWTEGGDAKQDWLDVEYDPAVTAPPGGRDIVIYLHASGGSHKLDASTPIGAQVRARPIANGAVYIGAEVTHPSNNPGTPHRSFGRLFQAIRALAPLWGARTDTITIFSRSRGNCGWWQAVQPDMIDAGATKFTERQSSLIFAVYSISGQSGYEVGWIANRFIVPGERAAVIAANPNPYTVAFGPGAPPDTGVLKNSAEDIESGFSPQAPWAVVQHEGTYWRRLVTKAESDMWGSHHPDMGLAWRDAYRSRGWGYKIAYTDESPGNDAPTYTEQSRFFWPWLQALKSGATSSQEALAIARASERLHGLYYLPTDLSGNYASNAGTGAAPTAGGPVGVIVDGQYGRPNRLLASPLGWPAVANTSGSRPILADLGSGRWGATFDAVDDAMRLMIPHSGGSNTFAAYCTDAGVVNTITSQSNVTFLAVGTPSLANKTVALMIGSDAAALGTNDDKIYRQFAGLLSGVDFGW